MRTERGHKDSRDGKGKGRFKSFAEKGRCRFCRTKGFTGLDYKDLATLQRLCTSQGKMYSRKRGGNCARHQRELKIAIKRARFMALLPYVSR